MAPHPLLVHGALLLVSLIFGGHYVTTKLLLQHVPVSTWVLLRVAGATLLLWPIAVAFRRRIPPARRWPALAWAALLGIVVNQVLFTEGLARTTPAHSAMMNATIPVWTMLFAVLLKQERATARKLVAIGLALAGVLTLIEWREVFEPSRALGDVVLGDLMSLGNTTAFSLFLVTMRITGRGLDPIGATATCFLFATLGMAVYSAPSLTGASVAAAFAPGVWPLALYGIVLASVVTYWLNNWALEHTHSSRVALYIYVQPVVATALAIALGDAVPGPRFWLAAALVFLGLVVEISAPASRSTA